MGEIADMMIDGTMCQGCGEWLNGGRDGPGYPVYCSSCRREQNLPTVAREGGRPKIECPTCRRRVRAVGLKDHQRDAHGIRV